jgi:hypothetical protein
MGEGDTLLNAVIGAVASIVLSFLPFGIVLGGAVAGYLQGAAKDYREGAMVGALAGLLALLPVAGLLFVIGGAIGFVSLELGALSFVVMLFVLFGSAVYFVGGGALGGAIGAYLIDEL